MTNKLTLVTLLALSLLLAACGGAAPAAQATSAPAAATATPTESPFANPSVPFEGVVQIWAMYYDENGEAQLGWTGSGTIISPDGYILTNAHVVLPDRYFPVDELVVAMTVGQDQEPVPSYFAETLQADGALDLAVIRVTHDYDGNEVDYASLNLPFVNLGNSDDLNLGDAITILGYPGIGGDTVTLTRGEVSGFTSQPEYGQRAFIKTSATIAGGNSGGLAADASGNIIGVPTQLGYGGEDQFVDCRVLADTNLDGFVDDSDSCVPTGGFINALRPISLALPFIEAAQRGEVSITGGEEPVVAMEPVATGGSVTDDFSDPASGWDILSFENYFAYYDNGEYFIQDFGDSTYYTAEPYLNFDNVEMTVEFRFEDAEYAEIDFVCRYLDEQNNYEFRVTSDGEVGISMWLAGEYIHLYDMRATGALFGNSMHQAQITCDGTYLGLMIDGEVVAETNDESLASGDVGLAVFNGIEGTYALAAFDNFEAVALGTQTASGGNGDGEVFIYEEFNDASAGWVETNEAELSLDVSNGAYLFAVNPDQRQFYSALAYDVVNIVINVDVAIEQAATDGDIGVLCRFVDDDNYYGLEVSEDGYYSIWKKVNGEMTYLVEWTYSDIIPTDGSSFVLNASCVVVGTWANPNLVVSFDNFEVIVYE